MAGLLIVDSGREHLAAELGDLRFRLVDDLRPALWIAAWVWFGSVMISGVDIGASLLPAIVLAGGAAVLPLWSHSHPQAACRTAAMTLMLSAVIMVAIRPVAASVGYSVITIVLANSLLGRAKAALFTTLSAALSVWAMWWGIRGDMASQQIVEVILLWGLTFGAAVLASTLLRRAAECALVGWDRRRDALL